MFQGPQSLHDFVVACKGCRQNIAAMVQTLPAQPIAVRCPLCSEESIDLAHEIFNRVFREVRAAWRKSSDRKSDCVVVSFLTMCGGYYRRSGKQRIGDAFNISDLPCSLVISEWDCNVASTTHQPVIRNDRETGN